MPAQDILVEVGMYEDNSWLMDISGIVIVKIAVGVKPPLLKQ